MKVALISLSQEGIHLAAAIASQLTETTFYLHQEIQTTLPVHYFKRVVALTEEIFNDYQGLIYIMPTGVVTRAIAPCIQHKLTDPAVVVVDVGGRWAISLLSGHEGGANDLALQVANTIGLEPIITTSTEAIRRLIVGIGCRRGMSTERLVTAIQQALTMIGRSIEEVRLFATAEPKQNEAGLIEAAIQLQRPLHIIKAQAIRASYREFQTSHFVQAQVHLPAVAEPAALLAGRNTQLLLKKQTFNGITIAIAEESCLWLASDPVAP